MTALCAPSTTAGPTRPARRIATGIAVLAMAALVSSCAAGMKAPTAEVKPALDATTAEIGDIQLATVALHAPSGAAYESGQSAQLTMVIVNNGRRSDTLVSVTTPAFAGWGIVPTADATNAAATGAAGVTIAAGSAVQLGLQNLGTTPDGASAQTLVLRSLTAGASPLYPGSSIKITFGFARAGSTTVTVPVQLSDSGAGNAVIEAPSGAPPE